MTVKLNTGNREYITWQYEQLNFGLLGGLKIEGLERMRVTLKVEYKQCNVYALYTIKCPDIRTA